MPTRVIFDTDIGTDVDDCLALAVILGSPELRLEGITTVYGDVALRARMVLKLLALRGVRDVPVYAGVATPLIGKREVYWAGHEGQGLLGPEDEGLRASDEHAVDYLVRKVMSEPGQIHLLAVGPLTNVAMAVRREPRFAANLAHLTIMGGVVRGPDRLDLPYVEHNIKCDPEAAHVVLSAGAPTTLVPLDVTTRVWIRREHLARLEAAGTPFHDAVADQVARYPRFAQEGRTLLHDPLAAATLVDPSVVTFVDAHVDVETGGEHTGGATLARRAHAGAPANARLAIDVDPARAEELVVSRLAS